MVRVIRVKTQKIATLLPQNAESTPKGADTYKSTNEGNNDNKNDMSFNTASDHDEV